MNIWRLGTNWEGTHVLDLILQSKIGFFGIGWSTDGVNEDDIIAIAKPGKKNNCGNWDCRHSGSTLV